MYSLPLSIFTQEKVLPAGDYQLILTCAASIIEEMRLYNHMFMPDYRFDDGKYYLDLEEVNLQNSQLNAGMSANSPQTLTLQIPEAAYRIAITIQDTRSGENTLITPNK